MKKEKLKQIAQKMVTQGKGILAADESTGTITKRLASIGVESTEENRQKYRELLFTTEGFENYISGVILFDETIRQSTKDGKKFVNLLKEKDIIPGIKVDKGAKPLALSEFKEETVTEGLDGLRERLKEYAELGAGFAKWRGVIKIGNGMPSDLSIHVDAHALARYAALCQEAGIVPIVEPEVLMDGNHSLETCYEVTKKTLQMVFSELKKQNVYLEGIILKPNMVITGKEAEIQASVQEVTEQTIKCFKETVPESVPGIVFLSGGQSEAQACENLSKMNNMEDNGPWVLSFSYGRALQASTLQAWQGKDENKEAAQTAFLKRCKLTSAAQKGEYTKDME